MVPDNNSITQNFVFHIWLRYRRLSSTARSSLVRLTRRTLSCYLLAFLLLRLFVRCLIVTLIRPLSKFLQMDEPLKVFGENIKKRREEKGISQEELANIAEFDRTYISLIERGKRNLSLLNICRFAKALDTKPFELIKNIK
jgi:DNA-binding XRE family transcriptional regulator